MGSDPMNAIVELITNCDDAYRALDSGRREKIRIEVERHRTEPTKIVVKDRAGGMTEQELEDRLGVAGERTSGFEAGAERRGLFGRGAKDIVHFGRARWESAKKGKLSYFELLFDGRFTGEYAVGPLGDAPRGRGGTEASLHVEPRFRVPKHETLLRRLRSHYALRPILLDTKGRDVLLADVSQDRDDRVRFISPKGKMLDRLVLPLSGFDKQQASIEIWESEEPLSEEGEVRDYWHHSLLITSGRAAYEIFDGGRFSREPYASHLRRIYGYVDVPGINELIREFDDAEESRRPPDDHNPLRLVKRDRHGLVARSQHPFVEALYTALEGALEPHLERLRKEAEDAEGKVSESARRRWDRAGRELAKLMEEDGPGNGGEGRLPPLGLSLVPGRLVVEPGDAARVVARYRPREGDSPDGPPPTVEVVETDEEGQHSPVSMSLEPRTGYFSKTYTVAGRPDGSVSEIVVRLREDSAEALIEWGQRTVEVVENLEFQHAVFSIKDGQERWVYLFAPWDMVMAADEQVQFRIEGDPTITPSQGTLGIFFYDEDRETGVCRLRVRGQGVGSRARLIATLGEKVAEAELRVTSGGVAGIKIEVKEFEIDQRAWFDAGTLNVNAKDPTVRRYLGPKSRGWPGQNSVPFNVMLAEVIVDAASRSQLLQMETDSWDASTLWGRQIALMRKWLPVIHRALVSNADVEAARDT